LAAELRRFKRQSAPRLYTGFISSAIDCMPYFDGGSDDGFEKHP
jgi:hypothetical protein